jgi:hypothetical protein
MRVPNFLIIGAMKAGTTTLYRDLGSHPSVYFPVDKEPSNLVNDDVLGDKGWSEYGALFRKAGYDQLCGEASTAYSKLPDYPDVAQRAWQVCGPNLRVIYLVREPVSRIVSQFVHERSEGRADVPEDFDQAIHQIDRFINYSRYAMQIEPWLDTFGPSRVKVLSFEDYTRDRRGTIDAVSRFLEIQPRPDLIDEQTYYNASAGKPVPTWAWKWLIQNPVYRNVFRRFLSPAHRKLLRQRLLPKSQVQKPVLNQAVTDFIYEQLREDLHRLADLTGITTG